jgi:hypothetical protein
MIEKNVCEAKNALIEYIQEHSKTGFRSIIVVHIA